MSFSVTPGGGRPTQPADAASECRWAVMKPASVEPSIATHGMRWPIGCECKFVKRVADMLSDACSGILQDPDAAEKVFPQRAVTTQPRNQFLVTLRNIRVEQRRDFAQVANRLLDLTRQWLAVVDIKRPAVVQCDAETYRAAEDMVPGQPVDEYGRLLGKHGVARQRTICMMLHSIRFVLITPFGTPVEPEVNSSLATVSGLTALAADSTASVGVVATQRIEARRATAGIAAHDDDLGILRVQA